MPSEVRPLRELCSLIADCPHSTPVWTSSGYIVIRNQNIKKGRLDLSAPSFTDAAHFSHRIRRAKPAAGDIIFTREAPMGEVCMIPAGIECCVGQRQVLLRPNPAEVDGRYLLYALQSPGVQHEIGWSEGTGSTVSNVRIPVLEALRIPAPPIETQRAIGQVLGALDERIDLLREANATLESIAAAYFKSWFIDFDPVHAKAEGREPEGMSADIAALFPSEFVDSELGEIPRGWGIGRLDDLLVLQRGFDLPATQRVPGKFPVLAASGPSGTHNVCMANGPGVTTGRSGVIGKVFYVHEDYWPLNTSLWVKEFKSAPPTYAFRLLKHIDLAGFNSGSAVPTLNRNHIHSLPVVLPPKPLVAAYDSIATDMLRRNKCLDDQADCLANLRDALLPELLAGRYVFGEENG